MKFWKKIYFSVFLLFLIFINGGIFLVYHISYRHNLEEEKTRMMGENEIIRRSLVDDISAFGKMAPGEREFRSIMEVYEDMFQNNRLFFNLWQNDSRVFCSEGVHMEDIPQEDVMILRREDGIQTIYLITAFKVNGDGYRLAAIRRLTGLTRLWDQLKAVFLFLSGMISVVLAVILYIIMRRLTRPLRQLSEVTRKVADGNYELIQTGGRDEIAELGRDFNRMTTAVQNRIQSQQRFVANLAHELRTPLTSIGGYSEYLLRGNPEKDRQFRALQYINKESRRMQQMAHQLLLLARVQSEQVEMADISIDTCLKEAYESCTPIIEEKEIKVIWGGEDFCVQGVYELLVCLCRNLLENAVRACEQGGEIHLFLGQNCFGVRDNGVGMDCEELNKIAEPFYRVDKARSRACGGAGLGLALCQEISELHRAEMRYESKLGEGTKVTVTFTTS